MTVYRGRSVQRVSPCGPNKYVEGKSKFLAVRIASVLHSLLQEMIWPYFAVAVASAASGSIRPFDDPSFDLMLNPPSNKSAFIEDLLSKLTVEELIHQVHLTFADNVIGAFSHNELYDAYVGTTGAGIGVIHDWYPTNKSQFNDLQKLNLGKMRIPIPFLQTGECLHGVGSFKQTIFPQQIAMAATFDPSMIKQVASAIGAEARSIGIHACFSPVLDLGKDTRWGRTQEGLGTFSNFLFLRSSFKSVSGEDMYLTSTMGSAYASGLSKDGTWSRADAVVPVMKASQR